MRQISVRTAILSVSILSTAAFARVHFRSKTTDVAYRLGQLKTNEGRLLEERSRLQSELARLSTKHKLEELAQGGHSDVESGVTKR